MHTSLKNFNSINDKINEISIKKQLKTNPKIIVVTKTFPLEKIMPILETGHLHYGENKIQEAEKKWSEYKKNNNVSLHMLGNLQTNKAKRAVKLFDYIHSLDNEKLAVKLNEYQKELDKKIKIFIQVNLANEKQKFGIKLNEISNFFSFCTKDLSLDIVGLMCLPPSGINSKKYFQILKTTADALSLKDLSMGMSSDFAEAILCGSTYLRLGTAILGERNIIK